MTKNNKKTLNTSYLDILSHMSGVSVLVVGDIMLDRYVYGHVDRVSPESPVPVLSVRREDAMLGGAGNALANLAGLGVRAKIVSMTGEDEAAEMLRQKIRDLQIADTGLLADSQRPTIEKTRYLAGHQQLLRTDYERKVEISDALMKDLKSEVRAALKDVQAVILSDYGKGLLQPALIKEIISAAKKAGVPVVVDPKGLDFTLYKGADVITPNKKELSEATGGMPVDTDEEVIAAANVIIKKCGIQTVVSTRSKDGISIIGKGKTPIHIPAADIEVFDVSGAGDTVIATIAAVLAAGGTFVDAGAMANLAGGIVVAKVGTAPIRAAELKTAIEREAGEVRAGRKKPEARIFDQEEAAEQVRRWRARGLRVGFTNGCFDILHYGHVSYLANAREKCDRLVVGLNTDSSVRILKGKDRPVHTQEARAGVLAALSSVDMVVLFGAQKEGDDNTANNLLEALHPDVYFKGGDYTEDQIPEAPTVRKYGGEVCVLDVYEGHSTTSSIKKIKDQEAA